MDNLSYYLKNFKLLYKRTLNQLLSKPNGRETFIRLCIIALLFTLSFTVIYFNLDKSEMFLLIFTGPVLVSALLFKTKGGIFSGVFSGILLFPFTSITPPQFVAPDVQALHQLYWGLGTGFYTLIGLIGGSTFEVIYTQFSKLESVSLFNPYSGLPSQSMLLDEVNHLKKSRDRVSFQIILVDLNNHAEIVNSIGHHQDTGFFKEITYQIKKRLNQNVDLYPSKLEIYHVYNDKLGILVRNINSKKIEELLTNLKKILANIFYYDNIPVFLDTHIGAAGYKSWEETTQESTFQKAFLAVEDAKKKKQDVQVFNPALLNVCDRNVHLLGEIRNGLKEKQFELYYLPKIDLNNNAIAGAEALIRWNHPQRGLIYPGDFIPKVEKTALINNISYWVMEQAAVDTLLFNDAGLNIDVAINITPRNLQEERFQENLLTIVKGHGLNPAQFELEITETDLIERLSESNNVINELAGLNFKLSMDDFGTGYSSLAYLKKLNFGCIKIDRTFINDISKDKQSYNLVAAAIKMGHTLDKKVIAEGVETDQDVKMLQQMNCDYAQGYYFSKPIPRAKFIEYYHRRKSRTNPDYLSESRHAGSN